MSHRPPNADEWARYIDGDVTENRAREIERAIADDKSTEREAAQWRGMTDGLAEPVTDDASVARVIDAVMTDLDDVDMPTPSRLRRWHVLSFAASVAAAIFLLVAPLGTDDQGGTFIARGGTADAYKWVGVELFVIADNEPIAMPERVTKATAYTAAYRNLSPKQSAHVLIFAVDAGGAVHWLFPAFVDARQDPVAITLPPDTHADFADAVVLEQPASGTMRVVTVITQTPLHVSDIESLDSASRETGALRQRFPDARIDERRVEVTP